MHIFANLKTFLLYSKRGSGSYSLPGGGWLFAIIIFILAQTAATIHAEVHPVHEHSVYCDAFDQASEPRVHSSFFSFPLPEFSTSEYLAGLYFYLGHETAYSTYRVRAPPSFSQL